MELSMNLGRQDNKSEYFEKKKKKTLIKLYTGIRLKQPTHVECISRGRFQTICTWITFLRKKLNSKSSIKIAFNNLKQDTLVKQNNNAQNWRQVDG